jgi:alpha-L-fucosidase
MALILVANYVFAPAGAGQGISQPPGGSPPAAAKRAAPDRQWFEDAKFGLAIRWGVYSLLDKDEWVMEHDKLPLTQYGKLLPRFNAHRFDAGAWVNAAKSSRARYLTVTAKHHDGFCMFATNLTTYDIVDATPYHTDPIHALAEACHQQGIKLFFYYSLLDWHHPDYFPLGKTGRSAGRDATGEWKRYVDYYQGQIRELCTNYGEVGGIRLDGCWDRPEADWQLAATCRLIREHQPRALIAIDSRTAARDGEDLRYAKLNPFRDDLSQVRKAAATSELPFEIWLPNGDAGADDGALSKTSDVEQAVHGLVGAAAVGANFTLEVRALPDGSLAPEVTTTLAEVGNWLEKYGRSVFGTRRGPIPPQPWGFSTATGSPEHPLEIYLHILTSKQDVPVVFDPSISWVPYLFGAKNPLLLTRSGRGLVLDLPPKDRLPIETIIILTPRVIQPLSKAR